MTGVYPEPILLCLQHPDSRVRDNSRMACSEASVPEMKEEALVGFWERISTLRERRREEKLPFLSTAMIP